MKKIFPLLILIIMLSFSFPFFHSGIFTTHDGENHIARLAAYSQAFADGQLLPQWAGNLNFGYGSPVLLFFYPLPGYIGSAVHSLGIGYTDSFKTVLLLGFMAAPLCFYFFLSEYFSEAVAFAGALVYGLTPYHFLDTYVRGDVGEVLSFVFIPLVFLFLAKNIKKVEVRFIALGGLSYFFLLISHNIMSLIFTPIFILYSVVFAKERKTFLANCILLGVGLGAAAYFWLPALLESKYLNKQFIGDFYSHNFPSFIQLLYSPWGFGADVLKKGGLSPQLGFAQICIFLASIVALFFSKNKKQILFWVGITFLGLFMTTSLSQEIWAHGLLLPQFQFPWRFDSLSTFAIAVLSGYVFSLLNRKILFLIVAFFIALSMPFTKVKGYSYHADSYFTHFPGTTFYHGEATTVWTAGDAYRYPEKKQAFIAGEGIIKTQSIISNKHRSIVKAETDAELVDNTTFFPGWFVFVDGKTTNIQFQNPYYRGLITFHIPKGVHTVVVTFIPTRIRKIADALSIGFLSGIIASLFVLYWKGKYGKKFA